MRAAETADRDITTSLPTTKAMKELMILQISSIASLMDEQQEKTDSQISQLKQNFEILHEKMDLILGQQKNDSTRKNNKRKYYGDEDGYQCDIEYSDEESESATKKKLDENFRKVEVDFKETTNLISSSPTGSSASNRGSASASCISSTVKRKLKKEADDPKQKTSSTSKPCELLFCDSSSECCDSGANNDKKNKQNQSTAKASLSLSTISYKVDKTDTVWNQRYKQLIEYKQKNGNCLVPATMGKLGNWVKFQRSEYIKYNYNINNNNTGPRSGMTPERIVALKKIEFIFEPLRYHWDSKFKELQEFHKKHNHCLVFTGEGATQLGNWVNSQRKEYRRMMSMKNKKGSSNRISPMTDERIEALESLGFVWEPSKLSRKEFFRIKKEGM